MFCFVFPLRTISYFEADTTYTHLVLISVLLLLWTVLQCLHKFRATAQENGQAYMAGEVESEMGILTKVVQAKDTLVTHGAAGCLQASARPWS